MYIYIYIHIYTYIDIHTYAYTYIFIQIYTSNFVCRNSHFLIMYFVTMPVNSFRFVGLILEMSFCNGE